MPIGLGSHVSWDRKIDGLVTQALMSINAVKAVSIGAGWEIAGQRGSQVQDVILPVTAPEHPWHRNTNRLGGTEGGMTNGMPLVARFAIKPIATMVTPLPSVDLDTGEGVLAHFERSDVCHAPPDLTCRINEDRNSGVGSAQQCDSVFDCAEYGHGQKLLRGLALSVGRPGRGIG